MLNTNYYNIAKTTIDNLTNQADSINKSSNKLEFANNILNKLNTIENEVKLHAKIVSSTAAEDLANQIAKVKITVEKNLVGDESKENSKLSPEEILRFF